MVHVSKTLAYALRHNPGNFGLTLSPTGWVAMSALIEGFASKGIQITLEKILTIVATDEKQRYAVQGGLIRANQGHSTPVTLEYVSSTPPEFLFHGTTSAALTTVLSEGIKPMSRHAVHLSESIETATVVGSRRGTPIILTVHALAMFEAGYTFQVSANNVWLTQIVPTEFITVTP